MIVQIVGGQTEAHASTIIDYHVPFDQGFKLTTANKQRRVGSTFVVKSMLVQIVLVNSSYLVPTKGHL